MEDVIRCVSIQCDPIPVPVGQATCSTRMGDALVRPWEVQFIYSLVPPTRASKNM